MYIPHAEYDQNEVRGNHSAYAYRQRFFNHSTIPLAIVDRTGLVVYVQPRIGDVDYHQGKFVVTRKYHVTKGTSSHAIVARNDRHAHAIVDVYNNDINTIRNRKPELGLCGTNEVEGCVKNVIDIPEEGEYEIDHTFGFLLCREASVDIALRRSGFLSSGTLVNLEPDNEGKRKQVFGVDEMNTLKSNIVVVDTDFRYQALWTNLHGQAIRIPLIRKRGVIEDGIHLNIVGTGGKAGPVVHIRFDDPDFEKKLQQYNIHFDMRSAEIGQTSKAHATLVERLKKAEEALQKKNKEYAELKSQFDSAQTESKLFKSNKQGNFILDVSKFVWTIFGSELKGLLGGLIFSKIFV